MRRLVVLFLLLLAAPAPAQEYSSTVSPEVVGPGERVTWRTTVRTTEAISLRLRLSAFTDGMADAPGFNSLRLRANEIHLEGPGTLQPGSALVSDPCYAFRPALPTYGAPWEHGFDRDGYDYQLDVPASSETVLVVPAETSTQAPWSEVIYRLAGRPGDPFQAAARSGGPTGVYLNLASDPEAQRDICGDLVRFASGQSVRLRGEAHTRDGETVDLVEYGPGLGEVRPIATVPVAQGRFAYDWAPPSGEHAVAVRYRSQRAEATDDFSRPIWFAVEPPPPVVAPALLGRAVVSGAFVTVRLNCVRACSGVLRLRHGALRAARRYSAAAGVVTRVRLRLPARTRRVLARRGRAAVTVEVAEAGAAPVRHPFALRRR
jgi:hypothetical protein